MCEDDNAPKFDYWMAALRCYLTVGGEDSLVTSRDIVPLAIKGLVVVVGGGSASPDSRTSFPCIRPSLLALSAFPCPSPSALCCAFATASLEGMVPRSTEKPPPTRALGYSHMTLEDLEGMILHSLVDRSQVRLRLLIRLR